MAELRVSTVIPIVSGVSTLSVSERGRRIRRDRRIWHCDRWCGRWGEQQSLPTHRVSLRGRMNARRYRYAVYLVCVVLISNQKFQITVRDIHGRLVTLEVTTTDTISECEEVFNSSCAKIRRRRHGKILSSLLDEAHPFK